jgi:ferric-dicitrate binding protein FerR (iron transport regulator)
VTRFHVRGKEGRVRYEVAQSEVFVENKGEESSDIIKNDDIVVLDGKDASI